MSRKDIQTIAERLQKEIYNKVNSDFIKDTRFEFTNDCSKYIAVADTYSNKITFYLLQMYNLSKKEIENVVIHEFFHIIANRYYRKNVHHGKEYKDMISKYGYDRNIGRATLRSEKSKESSEKNYKYKVVCRHCGEIIGYRQRKTNNIFFYRSKCCDSLLEFVENK